MPLLRPLLFTSVLVLTALLTSIAQSTRWPKPQITKKPSRTINSSGGRQTTTTTTLSPSSNLHTDDTTEVAIETYSVSSADRTTYSIDTNPTGFHTDTIASPEPNHGNYTLDYNECFFNVCDCCPPEIGPMGPMGEKGQKGERGLPGEMGEMGLRGLQGPAGLPGINGLNGDRGEKGDQGPSGLPGASGIHGKPGEKGEPGPRGEKGERGFNGVKGYPGERGEPGLNGINGSHGQQGLSGVPGVPGAKGQKGEQGHKCECLPGEKGERGDVGERGPSGLRGEIGPPGVNGTFGEKGERGEPGPPGGKGDSGMRGPSGPPGVRGIAGLRGERGPKGGRGLRGLKGAPGESVEQVRSAFCVGLFPSRSFPPPGLPVKFDKVFYNGEGHWDPTLNKFNITYPGVYLFTYHITVRNRPVRTALVVNGIRKLRTRDTLYGQDIDQASNLALLQLDEGDQVWLETLRDWNGIFSSSEDDSTFSGFLLYPDLKSKPATIANI